MISSTIYLPGKNIFCAGKSCLFYLTNVSLFGALVFRLTIGHNGLACRHNREAEGEDTGPTDGERGGFIRGVHRSRTGVLIVVREHRDLKRDASLASSGVLLGYGVFGDTIPAGGGNRCSL